MPETVAAWIAANTLTATSVLTYNQILVLTYVGFAAATAGYANHQKRKARERARQALNESLDDRLVMTATAQAARSRLYGRARNVDGVLFKQTHGVHKEYYTLVVAVAGHEVDAIETVYFNELPLTLDGSGYVLTEPYLQHPKQSDAATCTVAGGSGSVVLPHTPVADSVRGVVRVGEGDNSVDQTHVPVSVVGNTVTFSGPDGSYYVYYEYLTDRPMARVRKYLGTASQDLYTDLEALVGDVVQPSDWFRGIALLLVTLQFDPNAFPTGVPQISAVARGAKCYDQRTATTAWTENSAVIGRDWSLYEYGGGCVSGEINEAAFLNASNACDVSTGFVTPAGTETRPLYQCGIVVPLDGNPDDALGEITESMAGQWGWAGGKLSVRAGVYRAPVATIDEDWVTSADDINIVANTGAGDAVNVMRPTLADAAQHYTATPAEPVRATAFITADGRELPQELQLGGVTRAVHAQHVSGVLMREARESLTLTLPCNLRALPLELFDVVTVALPRFGWGAGKLFEVIGWEFTLTGGVLLTLRETAASIYTPDTLFDQATYSPNTGLPRPDQVPAVASLAATSGGDAQLDGSNLARVRLTWAASTSEAVRQNGKVEIQCAEVVDSDLTGDWPAAVSVSGRATEGDVIGLRIGAAYAMRARFVNVLGMAGPWSSLVHVVQGRRGRIVFRQTSAPSTGVQNGDEWFDIDDGNKHYVREAGAWVAVPVGTGGITPDAATQVDEFNASDVEITGASGSGPQGYAVTARWTPVATVSFEASFTGQATMFLAFQAEYSGAGGIAPDELWASLRLNADFDGDGVVDAGETLADDFARTPQTSTGVCRSVPISRVISIAITAGTTYAWNLYGQKLEGTVYLRNFYARVEQIKR